MKCILLEQVRIKLFLVYLIFACIEMNLKVNLITDIQNNNEFATPFFIKYMYHFKDTTVDVKHYQHIS